MANSGRVTGLAAAGLALALLTGALAMVASANVGGPPPSAECRADELLVKFRPGADPTLVVARHGGAITSVIAALDVYVVAIPAGTVEDKIAEFAADAEVDYAEANGVASAQGSAADSPPGCGSP